MSKIFLDQEGIKAFYAAAGKRSIRDECLVRIMGNTGFRVSDAISLLVSDVSDKNGEVYTSIRKKMKKTKTYIERNLSQATREVIKQYLPMVAGKSLFLFPACGDRSKHIGRTTCHELFKKILGEVVEQGTDIKAAATHTLRRSVGFLVSESQGIEVAAEFLGHKSIASTTSYLSKEVLKRKADEFLDREMGF